MTAPDAYYLTDDPALFARLVAQRALHIRRKRRQAARMLLDLPPEPEPTVPALTPDDLEQYVDDLRPLVPNDPTLLRAIGMHLIQHYPITPRNAPRLAHLLQLTDADLPATPTSAPEAVPDNVSGTEMLMGTVADRLQWRHFRRGESLYVQGDPADTLFVVVGGLVRVTRRLPDGEVAAIGELRSGSLLGERSLVLGEARSTTAYALQDTEVCTLPLPALQDLVQQDPQVMIKLLTEMAQRVQIAGRPVPSTAQGRVIALVPAVGGADAFGRQLADNLAHYGPTTLIDPARAQEMLAEFGPFPLEAAVDAYGFVDWMRRQAGTFANVIYFADPEYPNWARRVIEQADRLLIIGRAGDSPVLGPAELLMRKLDHPELLPPQELVLLHEREDDNPGDTEQWLARRAVIRHHHVAEDSGKGLDRVSRFIRGRAIGLALGGGGMRAAACAGVVQLLEEMGIRPDVVGGTSAGSIVAALYAMGYDAREMIDITNRQLMRQKIWLQPTLPLTSVMSGERLNQAYREVFGRVRMEDLWTSPFTISANLTRAEMVVHRDGPLDHAVRASTAIAGILPPALTQEGELLIDGGVFNNTPADVARAMVDTGPVIAVDLGYTKRRSIAYAYGDSLSGWKVFRSRINPFAEALETPSIVSVMMRANALGGITANATQLAQADLILRPPVGEFGLYDFDAADEIVAAGYGSAKAPLQAWIDAGGLVGAT
jgi:predicted acylesterase/phospholipase RssA/CRP-like cAMP-binding protein